VYILGFAYTAIFHKHKNFFVYSYNWFIFIEKNPIDSILDPPLLPYKRQLNFESGLDEKETKQPAAKRKRKLIQKSYIKVPYEYLVYS